MAKVYRLVPITDVHAGLKLAPMPPKFVEHPGSIYEAIHRPNETQRFLNKLMAKALKEAKNGEYDELVVVLLGDEVHGVERGYETWTGSPIAQADAYLEVVRPWLAGAKKVYMVNGTSYHMGEGGTIEDYIAREVGAYKRQCFHKLELKLGSIKVMLQHKGPSVGTRAWTRENSMFHHLKDMSIQAMQNGREPADLYLYGHFHTYLPGVFKAKGPWGIKRIEGYVLPAWCAPGEYALSNVRNLELADVGMCWFDIEGDTITEHNLIYDWDAVERVQ